MNDRNQALAAQSAGSQPGNQTRLEPTFELPQPLQETLFFGSAYELRVELRHTPYGHHVRFSSFVPSARRPEEQVKFQGLFSTEQLRALRDLIDREIGA